ncbi:SMP-30/gluconolactonase/LRE family protein [Paraglaciecola sp. MB-3u-78]|jgi:sugar lactone lactonase YvrE|uniref:SMP-30/gluconolactonase/LRE family protein n=1 Tax=Paraglaciecola sp. MB-3u-78 TaxID=2058332 RepID=UPI000C33D2F2|nr:SMP-30/gluconolactonase/LRE family protein [Paraglaciecola sp. MB-3u-78]PKH00165.1 gluconolactonase [Paraglaciecola sp. MB-3u-78]
MNKLILGLIGILGILMLMVVFISAPISPVAYSPLAPPELSGVLKANKLLHKSELLAVGEIDGPEEVAVDSQGRVYGGTQDGKIMILTSDGKLDVFAETYGRPLGMQFDKNENLIVCDADKGLLSINPQGKITVLATSANNLPFKLTDALDISSDGIIYFTDASFKYGQSEYLYDLLESKAHGRLLSYNPDNGQIKVLLSDLYFANGVALSQQEDFLLVNETYRYRIVRYWLQGPKAGTQDIFIDNLPGFPDNISSNGKGTFWLALFTVRNDVLDTLHAFPFLKAQMSKLPKALWPKPEPYGLVLALNEQGQITQSLHDPSGEHLKEITSAREYGGYLYLGSLHNDRIGKYKLP